MKAVKDSSALEYHNKLLNVKEPSVKPCNCSKIMKCMLKTHLPKIMVKQCKIHSNIMTWMGVDEFGEKIFFQL